MVTISGMSQGRLHAPPGRLTFRWLPRLTIDGTAGPAPAEQGRNLKERER